MGTALADPLVGTVLDGRYRVEAPVARGGMSTVYAATDLRLDRRVAVKVMAPTLTHDPAFTDRFVREARTAARLSHPNAVAVFDQGAQDGPAGRVVFLVMELVPGSTLRDVLRHRGRLRPDEAVSLLEPVLAALAGAHRAGLVHRDVKPENVLISTDGTVKVVDFGLARAVAAPSTSTQAGVVLGTVAYVAPEQVARGSADARTDVYSAGILLYELLTGTPPYAGDSAIAVAYRHVHDDVPPPSDRVPGLAPALDELVQRATRREPGARPADAGAFLAELAMVRTDLGLGRVPPRDLAPPPSARADAAGAPAGPLGPGGDSRPAGQVGRAGEGDPTRVGVPGGTRVGAPGGTWRAGAAPFGSPVEGDRPLWETRAGGCGTTGHRGGPGGPGGSGLAATRVVLPLDRSSVGSGRPGGTTALPAYGPGGPLPRGGATVSGWPAERRSQRRRRWVGLLCVLVLALTTGGAAWWFGSGRFVVVPPLVGLPRAAAASAVDGAGLSATFRDETSETVAAGRVVRSEPGSGDRVLRGRTITVVVSAGVPRVPVPDVVGRPRDEAAAAIRQAGLTPQLVEQPDDDVDAGEVVSQQPEGGSARRGSTVRVVVSTGPDLVEVPDVRGLSVSAARRALQDAGFKVKVRSLRIGTVVVQQPGPGDRRERGSTVTIYGF